MEQYGAWPNLAAMMFARAREWPERPMLRWYRGGAWQWPGDYFAEQWRNGGFGERAEEFARAATEKGEKVASITMDSVASALDIAARKLREAAEHLKTRQ